MFKIDEVDKVGKTDQDPDSKYISMISGNIDNSTNSSDAPFVQDNYINELQTSKKEAEAIYRDKLKNYRANGGNILKQHLDANKPQRKEQEKSRLRNEAITGALSNVLSLVGKGIGASEGIKQSPVDNTQVFAKLNELKRLEDLYEQEGIKWKENLLKASLQQENDRLAQDKLNIEMSQKDAHNAALLLDKAVGRKSDKELANQKAIQQREAKLMDYGFRAAENQKNRNARMASDGITRSGHNRDWLFDVSDVNGNSVPITNASLSHLKLWAKNHPDKEVRKMYSELEYQSKDIYGSTNGQIKDAQRGAMVSRVADLTRIYQKEISDNNELDDVLADVKDVIISDYGGRIPKDKLEELIDNSSLLLTFKRNMIYKYLNNYIDE